MQKHEKRIRLAVLLCVAFALAGSPSAAQDVSGLTFDVTVTTGDSATQRTQTGRGWVAGQRTRLDLRGPGDPAEAPPGVNGENISMIVVDSGGTPTMIVVDHDTKTFMYPTRMMEQLKEMMASLPEQPKVNLTVANVTVDTVGSGETISGFATTRFKLGADVSVAIEIMGEQMEQTMRIESEADIAQELSAFSDPLRDTRGFNAIMSAMPFMDSTATAQMQAFVNATPRGLPLRQVDVVTGSSMMGDISQRVVTVLSNVKLTTFSPTVFAMPEGYTETAMPQIPGMN